LNFVNKLKYLSYRIKYRYARELNLDRPVDVSLELAAACNLACNYCYWANPKEIPFKKGFMQMDTAMLIITDAAHLGVNSIKLNWKGESTLNPRFYEITKFAKQHASGSTFIDRLTNSNFMFKTEREDIFQGLCNQTKVKVSFDSFIPEVMQAQRAKSDHSLVMKNVDYFYNYKDRKDTIISIQAVRTKLNKDEDIAFEVKRRWPEAEVSVRDMVGGRVDSDLTGLENRSRENLGRQSCIQAHARLVFNWSGDAMVCCVDLSEKLKMGNIHDKAIYEIFNSKEAKEFRKQLKNKSAFKLDPCKTCSSWESYKGYKHPWGS